MKTPSKADRCYFFKTIFLPLMIMLGLGGISAVLFQAASQFFLKDIDANRSTEYLNETLFSVALAFFLTLRPLRAWFSTLLTLFILGQVAFYLSVNWETSRTTIAPYLALLLKPSLLFIVMWGFANQITTVSEGMKYYIPLTFFSSLIVAPFTFFSFTKTAECARVALIGSMIALALTWIGFRWLSAKLPAERWLDEKSDIEPTAPSYIFRFAYGFGAFALMRALLDPLFRASGDVDPLTIAVGILLLSVGCYFFGQWLLKQTGWFLSVLTPSLIATITIAIFYVFYVAKVWVSAWVTLNEIVLRTLPMMLLYPLLQIGYLSLLKKDRFQTKAWAEIVFAPIVISSAAFILPFILSKFESAERALTYVVPLAIGVAVAMSPILAPIGKRKGLLPQPKAKM